MSKFFHRKISKVEHLSPGNFICFDGELPNAQIQKIDPGCGRKSINANTAFGVFIFSVVSADISLTSVPVPKKDPPHFDPEKFLGIIQN